MVLLLACAPGSFLVGSSSDTQGEEPSSSTDEERPENTAPSGPTCAPWVEVETPTVLEGEEVRFTAGCSERTSEDFLAEVTLPDGAAWDAASWTFSWETDLSDADPYEIAVSVTPLEAPAAVPESVLAAFSVADAHLAPDNEPVDPERYTSEWGLPVLHLDPAGGVSESYGPAVAHYRGRRYEMEIKLRGAASLAYPKNSYTLSFSDDDQLDLDGEGLGDKKHVALVTTFDDNSYVRQKLIYDTWAQMSEAREEPGLALRSFFVVVYLEGGYHGLYLLTDKVDDELMRQLGLHHDANLYKSVNHDANFYATDSSGNPKDTLHDGYEKKEGTPEDGEPGAYDDLDALVAFSAESEHAAFAEEVDGWLPVEAWMDWLLLVHYSASDDSGGKNVYLYNDPAETRWYPHPWDFNHSWGQNWYTLRLDVGSYNDFSSANGIFDHFLEGPELAGQLNERLHAAMDEGGPLATETLLSWLEGYYELIEASAERDWELWEEAYRSAWWASYRDDWTSFSEERAYLEAWIEEREAWIRHYDLGG